MLLVVDNDNTARLDFTHWFGNHASVGPVGEEDTSHALQNVTVPNISKMASNSPLWPAVAPVLASNSPLWPPVAPVLASNSPLWPAVAPVLKAIERPPEGRRFPPLLQIICNTINSCRNEFTARSFHCLPSALLYLKLEDQTQHINNKMEHSYFWVSVMRQLFAVTRERLHVGYCGCAAERASEHGWQVHQAKLGGRSAGPLENPPHNPHPLQGKTIQCFIGVLLVLSGLVMCI